jgi:hypothetical protein
MVLDAIRLAMRNAIGARRRRGMFAICDYLIQPRCERRRVVTWTIGEHRRRQDEADCAKREAEAEARTKSTREAELERRREWLRNLLQAREHSEDDGPLPGGLTESLSAKWVNRAGRKGCWRLRTVNIGQPSSVG